MHTLLQNSKKSFLLKFKSKLFTLSAIFFIILFAPGCSDSRDDMADFIKGYNEQSSFNRSPAVVSTSAEADYKDKIIKIKVVTTYALDDPEINFIRQAMPNAMMELLSQQSISSKLINAGVKFEITYFTNGLSEIATATLDKKKMEALSKATPDLLKNNTGLENQKAKDPSDQIFATLNKSLPYTDPSTGSTIFKIDKNSTGDIVYHVRVTRDLAAPLKTQTGVELMKEEILRSGKLKKMLAVFRELKITAVKYAYYDQKGNKINEFRLTTADLN